jgi:hypothetical protein
VAAPASEPAAPAEWAALLDEESATPPQRRRLGARSGGAEGLLVAALAALAGRDREAHARRIDELGYLANVLLAGASIAGRRYRPAEAAEAALALCDRGLLHVSGGDAARAIERLATDGADKLFSIGWHLEHATAK